MKPAPRSFKAQSMIEFMLIMPIMVVILVAGATIGTGIYDAHMVSDAIRQPATMKLQMSGNPNAVTGTDLQGIVNGTSLQGNLQTGALVNNIQVIPGSDPYTTLVIGSRQFNPGIGFIPNYTISVAQVMNSNLLQPANNGALEVRPYTTPWVPYGAPAKPPWEP